MVKNRMASFENKSLLGLNRNKLITKGAVLGLAGAALLGAACSTETTVGFKNDKGEVIYEQSVDDVLDGKSPEVARFDEATLSHEAVVVKREFDAQRHEILDKILDLFEKDGFKMENHHMYEGRSIELASPDMSPVAILDRSNAKATFLTTNPDQAEALSQIEFAARPGTRAYQNHKDRINKIHRGSAKISADESLLIESKYFEDGTFYDESGSAVVAAEDTPTYIISAMSQRERKNTIFTFQWDEVADGSEGEWRVITAAVEKGDLGYVDPLDVEHANIK